MTAFHRRVGFAILTAGGVSWWVVANEQSGWLRALGVVLAPAILACAAWVLDLKGAR